MSLKVYEFKSLIVCAHIVVWIANVSAQDIPEGEGFNIIEQTIEFIAENSEEEEIDVTTLFDDLTYYYNSPLNLNISKKEELERLILLNEFQINNLLNHIDKFGKLMSIYELQAVEGFDLVTIRKILPFVRVSRDIDNPNLSIKEVLKNSSHEIIIRTALVLEQQKGFTPPDTNTDGSLTSRYLGSMPNLYTRYRFRYSNKISIGFTGEKDSGEEFFKGTNRVSQWYKPYQGFDFYSAHFYMKGLGKIKYLAIGDYQLQFGQGVTFWSGLAFGKSAFNTIGIKRTAQEIKPYTSLLENDFLRGGATTVTIKDFDITGFFSQNKYDASISQIDTITEEITEVSAVGIGQAGYHRTESENIGKNSVRLTIYGGHLKYKKRNYSMGLTYAGMNIAADLNPAIKPYSQFRFSGTNNYSLGADYSYLFRNFNFFGEFSGSANGAMAYVNGVIIGLDPQFSVSILHRNYQKDYQPIVNNPFRESTAGTNEKGIYIGFEVKPYQQWIISGYYDAFSFPWLGYTSDAPSQGREFLVKVTHKPSKKIESYIQYTVENKQENDPDSKITMDQLAERSRQRFRYHFDYRVSKSFKLRSRLEFSYYQIGSMEMEKGYLILQDIIYKSIKSPVSATIRYSLFDTDSYNSRIYTFEHDLIAFSIPGFSDKGSRFYLMLRYHVRRGIDLWLRYSQTYYHNEKTISSGLTEIQGNTKSEIKAQLSVKF